MESVSDTILRLYLDPVMGHFNNHPQIPRLAVITHKMNVTLDPSSWGPCNNGDMGIALYKGDTRIGVAYLMDDGRMTIEFHAE